MFDVATIGELLIDFTECGISENGNRIFEQNPGGAVANVAAAVSKMGLSAAFIGKVGNDMHGLFLQETMEQSGVNTKGLLRTEEAFTTLAFVALRPDGERMFSFARKPGADLLLRPQEIDCTILDRSKILHTGSLSLAQEPCRSAVLYALDYAKKNRKIISYDPNYRASLWDCEETAVKYMRLLVNYADFIKVSEEELLLITGSSDPENAARILQNSGVACVAVTLGAKGALVSVRGECRSVSPFSTEKVVDTTGAGDSFWGAFLSRFISSGKDLQDITAADAADFAKWGNAAASLCIQKRGGIPAMPPLSAVEAVLKSSNV
ncbi:MAG: carbohydrate kinase [Clostridiales bacterium]|jgi:fructokinase|nr:carbohydrate kinase [Clostridiales bacterium]